MIATSILHGKSHLRSKTRQSNAHWRLLASLCGELVVQLYAVMASALPRNICYVRRRTHGGGRKGEVEVKIWVPVAVGDSCTFSLVHLIDDEVNKPTI